MQYRKFQIYILKLNSILSITTKNNSIIFNKGVLPIGSPQFAHEGNIVFGNFGVC